MKNSQLALLSVKKSFKKDAGVRSSVLRGVDAKFESGKTYAITGVSGTGKSTLLHLIAGLDTPTSGKVEFDGRSLQKFSSVEREQFLQKSIGLVFQSPYLIRELSVLENLMMPALIAGISRADAHKKAQELLKSINLEEKAADNPSSLSGGQQQRVAVARAIVNEPAFLLADEPTGNLDIKTGKQVVALLNACHKKWGMGIIVASHDAHVARSMEHVFVLKDGLLQPV